ncbi:hypothetical protein EYF80_040590 [Liparis tanakae]|uniref:Uncharacterized protein n=1 Tax=Liparis tanakae TaxID=230148 RepID=A0A4Z2G8U0_9TELE|nr:hypothetical protein EYF80_040590 [Liparis tanakae]
MPGLALDLIHMQSVNAYISGRLLLTDPVHQGAERALRLQPVGGRGVGQQALLLLQAADFLQQLLLQLAEAALQQVAQLAGERGAGYVGSQMLLLRTDGQVDGQVDEAPLSYFLSSVVEAQRDSLVVSSLMVPICLEMVSFCCRIVSRSCMTVFLSSSSWVPAFSSGNKVTGQLESPLRGTARQMYRFPSSSRRLAT